MIEPEAARDSSLDEKEHAEAIVIAHMLFKISNDNLGTIDNPTKQGFLALARQGASVWNAWRQIYRDRAPDFSGMVFDEEDVSFSGFVFSNPATGGACVDFSGATFNGRNNFYRTVFGDRANFASARFTKGISFSRADFGIGANFRESDFLSDANFQFAKFGADAVFANATFHSFADFGDSFFDTHCNFSKAIFSLYTNFRRSTFSGLSAFHSTKFCAITDFTSADFGGSVFFSTDVRDGGPKESQQFFSVRFNGATFRDRASFTGRQFLAATDFGIRRGKTSENGDPSPDKPTRFMGIPDFHGCKFHQDTNFDGAIFETPLNQEAARAFRTLKLAMEQLKATREEQKFFRLEMKAEHPSLPWGKRWISTLYSLFSDYGFSLWRPIVWLLSLSLLFGMAYGLLANNCVANTHCMETAKAAGVASRSERTSAVVKYTLASVAPVPGLDKMQTELRAPLFGHHGWVPIAALTLEILHKIVALVMVFLFALALRNLFKMKS